MWAKFLKQHNGRDQLACMQLLDSGVDINDFLNEMM